MKNSSVLTVAIVFIAVCSTSAARSAVFRTLPTPPGYGGNSAAAISADGSVIVGSIRDANNRPRAYRWTPAAGAAGFEILSSPDGFWWSASDVSGDGSAVVGWSTKQGSFETPVMWTNGNVFQRLRESDGQHHVRATCITSDGLLVSGKSRTIAEDGPETAFTWSQAQGYAQIAVAHPFVAPDEFSSAAHVLVGQAGSTFAGRVAFRWTPEGGAQLLGTFSQPLNNTVATATNGDGSIIVGTYLKLGAGGSGVFRWTQQTGIIPFDDLGFFPSAMSADGSVIVGGVRIWDAVHGTRLLKDVLAARGVDIGAWIFFEATDISADGMKIAGNGYNPAGNPQAWFIDLSVPEPSAAGIAILGIFGGGIQRLGRRARGHVSSRCWLINNGHWQSQWHPCGRDAEGHWPCHCRHRHILAANFLGRVGHRMDTTCKRVSAAVVCRVGVGESTTSTRRGEWHRAG